MVETTKEERDQARQTGRCPKCKGVMQDITPPSFPQKGELYCEVCHLSVAKHE